MAPHGENMVENLQDRVCEKEVESLVAFPREAGGSLVGLIPPSLLYLFMVPKRLGCDWSPLEHGVHHGHISGNDSALCVGKS